MSTSGDAGPISIADNDAKEEAFLQRMYDIHDRDKIKVASVKLVRRSPSEAAPETHMLLSETFVFNVDFDNFGRRSAQFTIVMTDEMSRAMIAEYPEEADMLTAALSELASLGQRLYDEASRRPFVWEKFRTRGRKQAGSCEGATGAAPLFKSEGSERGSADASEA